jgi:hypothetical protein
MRKSNILHSFGRMQEIFGSFFLVPNLTSGSLAAKFAANDDFRLISAHKTLTCGRPAASTKTMIPTNDQTHRTEETESTIMSRRSLLSGVGMTGLAWLGSSALGSAFSLTPKVTVVTSRSNASTAASGQASGNLSMPDLPQEWLERHGKYATEYFRYLTALKLKRVDPAQVLESHAKERGGVWNSIPPKASWRRMAYTLRVAERVAQEMNVSEVEIISAYRSPDYNARCRGARTHSWHQQNIAVDVKLPMRASKVTAMARQLRDEGLFRGGVGGYWNFTHIDARGQNINW